MTLPWVDVVVARVAVANEVRALMLTVPPPDWTETGGQMNCPFGPALVGTLTSSRLVASLCLLS